MPCAEAARYRPTLVETDSSTPAPIPRIAPNLPEYKSDVAEFLADVVVASAWKPWSEQTTANFIGYNARPAHG